MEEPIDSICIIIAWWRKSNEFWKKIANNVIENNELNWFEYWYSRLRVSV